MHLLFELVTLGEVDPVDFEKKVRGLFPDVNPLSPVDYFSDLLKSSYFRRADNTIRLQLFLLLTSKTDSKEKEECFIKIFQSSNNLI